MTDLLYDDPCILFALEREASAFLREFRVQEKFAGSPCWARFCGPAWLSVLVVQTGIGPTCMRGALEWVLSRPKLGGVVYRPKLIVSAGFSGALADGYRVGDIVLATEVCDAESQCWPTTWPGELPSGAWQPPLRRARTVTASHLVGAPEEKRALGRHTEAVAVDMECAVIAELCARHDIPFGCVRAISDDVHTGVSAGLVKVLSAGRVSLGRLGLAVVRSPRMIGELWRLSRQTRLAAKQLSLALGELLTLTLPWAEN